MGPVPASERLPESQCPPGAESVYIGYHMLPLALKNLRVIFLPPKGGLIIASKKAGFGANGSD